MSFIFISNNCLKTLIILVKYKIVNNYLLPLAQPIPPGTLNSFVVSACVTKDAPVDVETPRCLGCRVETNRSRCSGPEGWSGWLGRMTGLWMGSSF